MRDDGTTRSGLMGMRVASIAVVALGGALALPTLAQPAAQQTGAQDSSSAQTKQQSQQKPPAHKSAAQENPFPADTSKEAAQPPDQANKPPSAPDAGQPPSSGPKPGDAARDNPFPEDLSRSAAAAAAKDSDAGTGTSSSSSSSSNPGGNGDPDADIPPDTSRRKLKKPSDKDIQSGSLAGEGRAQEDVRVGRFYLGTGNYRGAYGRFSEAARLDPTNINAIYGLAASAEGLHHREEALTNYKLYLDIAPDGDKAKSARKAIQSLSK